MPDWTGPNTSAGPHPFRLFKIYVDLPGLRARGCSDGSFGDCGDESGEYPTNCAFLWLLCLLDVRSQGSRCVSPLGFTENNGGREGFHALHEQRHTMQHLSFSLNAAYKNDQFKAIAVHDTAGNVTVSTPSLTDAEEFLWVLTRSGSSKVFFA